MTVFKSCKVMDADASTPSPLLLANPNGTFQWNAHLDKLISTCETQRVVPSDNSS